MQLGGKLIIIIGAVLVAVLLAAMQYSTSDDAVKREMIQTEPVSTDPRPAGVHPDAMKGKITRIVDGDTLHFDAIAYRLSLIDTPERGEDGALEATKALKALCPKGSTAYMDEDSITPFDKYGRHLGTVWCEGNDYATTAGAWLHENGYLEKFYTDFCGTTEAATPEWATVTGVWMYYEACN